MDTNETSREEAGGPLLDHLAAIAADECIHDDQDVFAVLQAVATIKELEADKELLTGAILQHQRRVLQAEDEEARIAAERDLWAVLGRTR